MASALQDVLLRVKEGADIVQIVGQYVPLKRAGSRYLGLCPFHNDRHPSMNVNPGMGIYKCFACGAGGDAIKFVQEYEKLGFVEALRLVASKAGIPIPENFSFGEKGDADKTAAVVQANAIALQVYVESLENSPAWAYLQERELSRETVKHFQIGYAPETPDLILKRAQVKKIPVAAFVEAGILGEAAGGRIYDRFSGRLIFPIFNLSSRVIAFGGRILPGKEGAKYINTPESPLYQKSKVLYGFNFARAAIDQNSEAVLVEGYMDLVSLWQAGVKNAVAVCGTAFTKEHGQTLGRFARKAFLFFDGDEAGRKAVHRSLEPLLAQGVEARVPVLPESEDPDSYVRAHTPEDLQNLFAASDDLHGFLMRDFGKPVESLSPEEKETLLRDAAELLKQSPSAVVRDEHTQNLRKRLGLRPATVGAATRAAPTVALIQDGDLGLFVSGANLALRPEAKPEWQLLQLLLAQPAALRERAEALDLAWFSDDRVRDLFDHALALLAEKGELPLRELSDRVAEPLRDALAALEISAGEVSEPNFRFWGDHVAALELRHLVREKHKAVTHESSKEIQKRIDVLQSLKGENP